MRGSRCTDDLPGTDDAAVGTPATKRLRRRALLALAVLTLLLAGCAAGPNSAVAAGSDAGFWLGLWHGVILPVTFVISLFTENVNVYEVDNTGNWYDVGFLLGLLVSLGGAGGSGAAAGRKR